MRSADASSGPSIPRGLPWEQRLLRTRFRRDSTGCSRRSAASSLSPSLRLDDHTLALAWPMRLARHGQRLISDESPLVRLARCKRLEAAPVFLIIATMYLRWHCIGRASVWTSSLSMCSASVASFARRNSASGSVSMNAIMTIPSSSRASERAHGILTRSSMLGWSVISVRRFFRSLRRCRSTRPDRRRRSRPRRASARRRPGVHFVHAAAARHETAQARHARAHATHSGSASFSHSSAQASQAIAHSRCASRASELPRACIAAAS